VLNTYEYDAWGNTVSTTGTTPNIFLYRGEQYDLDLGLYYLRARYLNPATGSFTTRDSYPGSTTNPVALHKYLYAYGDPVGLQDPSGMDPTQTVTGFATSIAEIRYGKQGKSPGRVMTEYTLLVMAISSPFAAALMPDGAVFGSAQTINCIWKEAGSWLAIGVLAASGNIPAAVTHIPDQCEEEPQKKSCKQSIYSEVEECHELGRGFDFPDADSAAKSISKGAKPIDKKPSTACKGGYHYDVYVGSHYESILCCPCCDDTTGNATLLMKCKVTY
jgi:RHS repeat-associated protein